MECAVQTFIHDGGKMASGTGSLETEVLIFVSAPSCGRRSSAQPIYMNGKVHRRRFFLTRAGNVTAVNER